MTELYKTIMGGFPRTREVLTLSFLALLIIFIYSNSLQGEFVFDDWHNIVDNSNIRVTQLDFKSVDNVWETPPHAHRPLSYLSFALNFYFHRYDVYGYHLVNVFTHIVTGLFLFYFIKLTLGLPALRNNYGTCKWLPLIAVLIWLIHPVQTGSVSYVVQRMTIMASMFYVLSIYLYARARIEQEAGRRRMFYSGCILAGLCSFGSKEIAAMLPLFIFLYEWYFFRDLSWEWIRRNLLLMLGLFAFFAVIGSFYLGINPVEAILKTYAHRDFTLGQRVLTELRVIIFYISLIFYPHPSRLNLTHDFPVSYSLLDPVTTLFALLAITGMLVLAIYLARRERLLSFCIIWFFGNLLIESSVIGLELVFEHRLYLPSMLAVLFLVLLCYRYMKPQWLGIPAVCIAVLLLSSWAYQRNEVWRDRISLWRDSVSKSPRLARPQNNLAAALIDAGDIEQGLVACREAQNKEHDYADAYGVCGYGLRMQGKFDEAIDQYTELLRLQPANERGHNHMAIALIEVGEIEKAIGHCRQALNINPLFEKAHITWGYGLFKRGETDAAISHYREALRLNPASEEGHNNMAEALIKQGRIEEGIAHCRMALEINPGFADAHGTWGNGLYLLERYDEAIRHFKEVLRLKPSNISAHNNLGAVLLKSGRVEQAVIHFQEALKINPEYTSARNNLQMAQSVLEGKNGSETHTTGDSLESHSDPVFYYEKGARYKAEGKVDEAIQQYQKALSIQPGYMAALNDLALVYYSKQDYDNALALYRKMIEIRPRHYIPYYNIACIYAQQNKLEESLEWLKGAVERGFSDTDYLRNDPDLKNIRGTEYFKELTGRNGTRD